MPAPGDFFARRAALAIVASAMAIGTSGQEDSAAEASHAPADIEAQLIALAAERDQLNRVSGSPLWAPTLCVDLMTISRSDDEATHGRKMYYLYASKPNEYLALAGLADPPATNDPIGQAIVKETWLPIPIEELTEDERERHASVTGPDGRAYAFRDRGPIFMMLKTGGEEEWTDSGWVYATLTPDGSQVTASGRLESCMKCHVEAPHDRLFGPQKP